MAIPSPRRHAKRYILTALAGMLAVTLTVIVTSAALRPAHLVFTVDEASNSTAPFNGVYLNLTLEAENPSRRAGVRYENLNVNLWYSTTDWIQPNTSLGDQLPFHQPQRNKTSVNVTVLTLDNDWLQEYISTNFSVIVTALVQFKVGFLYTRPYNVRVSCSPVNFLTKPFAPVNCTG